ncbi:MAG: S8 family serine peptidase [Owenweeksia sp.]
MKSFLTPGFLLGLLIAIPSISWSFIDNPGDSIDEDYVNWYNQDPDEDKVLGAAVNRAYKELLNDRTPEKKIVVAVIDGGVDIDHEDLKGRIWINKNEIPDNGIDDDSNGFVDDLHGWNFLGNSKGENIVYGNYEFVRILRDRAPWFEGVTNISEVPDSLHTAYREYKQCQALYEEKLDRIRENYKNFMGFEERFNRYEDIIKKHLDQKTNLTLKDVYGVRSQEREVLQAKGFLIYILENGFSYADMKNEKKHMEAALNHHLNLAFDPRSIINDDLTTLNNPHGNPDVKGTRAKHGTMVSGIIAAGRDNAIGIDGIASNVEIMALRTVPDGDEYDRDVALSIIYAVNNGANVINMSFGKDYSPQKHLVDEALKYAASKNVLIVHAAGNSSDNLDTVPHFPIKYYGAVDTIQNWMVVGANDRKKGKKMVGTFSCYGSEEVDLFAPGVNVVSTKPNNGYDVTNGTSFSCPVVSGVAALVWSYYPELSAVQLKEILMASATDFGKKKVYQPNKEGDKEKIRFSELSRTGGIVNAYEALLLAEKYVSGEKVAQKN